MATIKHIYVYDDKTNTCIADLCNGDSSFSSFDDAWKLVQRLNISGCRRIEAIKYKGGEFGTLEYGREVYLRTEAGWIRNADSKVLSADSKSACKHGLPARHHGTSTKQQIDLWYPIKSNDIQLDEVDFWETRRNIQCALIDIDPANIMSVPVFTDNLAAYASESYEIAEIINGLLDRKILAEAVTTVLKRYYFMNLEDEKIDAIVKHIESQSEIRRCPVCRKQVFEKEGDICFVCGWVHNSKQEDDRYAISHNNAESLMFRQLFYYLVHGASNNNSRSRANAVWDEYVDMFQTLMKVKKAFPEKEREGAIYYDGVDINKYSGEFYDLREKAIAKLSVVFVEEVLGVDSSNKYYNMLHDTVFNCFFDNHCSWAAYECVIPLINDGKYYSTYRLTHGLVRIASLSAADILTVREQIILNEMNIYTLRDLETYPLEELFDNDHLGKRSALRLVDILDFYGADTTEYQDYIEKKGIQLSGDLHEITPEEAETDLKEFGIYYPTKTGILTKKELRTLGDWLNYRALDKINRARMFTPLYDMGIDISKYYDSRFNWSYSDAKWDRNYRS